MYDSYTFIPKLLILPRSLSTTKGILPFGHTRPGVKPRFCPWAPVFNSLYWCGVRSKSPSYSRRLSVMFIQKINKEPTSRQTRKIREKKPIAFYSVISYGFEASVMCLGKTSEGAFRLDFCKFVHISQS